MHPHAHMITHIRLPLCTCLYSCKYAHYMCLYVCIYMYPLMDMCLCLYPFCFFISNAIIYVYNLTNYFNNLFVMSTTVKVSHDKCLTMDNRDIYAGLWNGT